MNILSIATLVLLAPSQAAQEELLARRAAAIRPSPSEDRWREIPWIASLREAKAAAEREDLPLFVWAADDDPLERC
jgi:hypothetical protein